MKIISFVLFFVSIMFINGCAPKQAILKADTLYVFIWKNFTT